MTAAAGDGMAIERSLAGCRVVFTTRLGGVSGGPFESLNLGMRTGDDPDSVARNRRRVSGRAGLDPHRVAMGWQVHGTELHEWEAPPEAAEAAFAGRGDRTLAHVDGHLTSLRRLGLLVLVADCLPIALVAPERVAIVHGGWRGLAAGILERALEAFADPPAAVIGPGIGRCCYEVGDEVLAAFDGLDGVAAGRMLDLRLVARRKLAAAGVGEVDDVDLCTSCRADLFFSHRRDRAVTGRQAGLAWIE